jgi:hypothetical protein
VLFRSGRDIKSDIVQKEQTEFDRTQGLANRLLSVLSQKPQLQTLLLNRTGTPKAKGLNPYDLKGMNPIGRLA